MKELFYVLLRTVCQGVKGCSFDISMHPWSQSMSLEVALQGLEPRLAYDSTKVSASIFMAVQFGLTYSMQGQESLPADPFPPV